MEDNKNTFEIFVNKHMNITDLNKNKYSGTLLRVWNNFLVIKIDSSDKQTYIAINSIVNFDCFMPATPEYTGVLITPTQTR